MEFNAKYLGEWWKQEASTVTTSAGIDEDPQHFDFHLFGRLFCAYIAAGKGADMADIYFNLDVSTLLAWMKLALLCNSMFRFLKFNVDFYGSENDLKQEEQWEAFKELQLRVKHLEREEVKKMVGEIMGII